jgi:hypothetical protein
VRPNPQCSCGIAPICAPSSRRLIIGRSLVRVQPGPSRIPCKPNVFDDTSGHGCAADFPADFPRGPRWGLATFGLSGGPTTPPAAHQPDHCRTARKPPMMTSRQRRLAARERHSHWCSPGPSSNAHPSGTLSRIKAGAPSLRRYESRSTTFVGRPGSPARGTSGIFGRFGLPGRS